MKKVFIILICFILLVGCTNEKEEVKSVKKEEFVIEKIDSNKDFVYFNKYKEISIGDDNYIYQYPVVNIKSDEVDNLNLELKNFVIRSYKDAGIYEGILNSGNVIDYKYYVTDDFISIVQSHYYYIDGMIGEYDDKVYVLSFDNGKILNNEDILKKINMTEDVLYDKLEKVIDSEDVAFSLMNIKESGYSLYVNNEDKLCIIYYEVTNDEGIRKELVLN